MKETLKQLGITPSNTLYHNLSYDELFKHETNPNLTGNEVGIVTELGAVTVDTGRFTGRSAKDKYFVKDANSEKAVWWKEDGSDNNPITPATWNHLRNICDKQLSNKPLYIMDGFCGANPESRLNVRLITEVAWQAHFFKNMFIRPSEEELKDFVPDWTILNACKTSCTDFEAHGLRADVFIAFNIAERMTLLGGTWYAGEIKKGIFSMMNYFLPLEGIGAFHCSANEGKDKSTALFFGLSGTGKTTLSTDPDRALIGDDEHGWDDNGIFNFEGGCYAKTIRLSKEKEPEIYGAIKRNALLENVVIDENGKIDFDSHAKTENTRVSYPIEHIENIVRPTSNGTHPKTIIFLTCDAYGVLPPVSKLSKAQAMYQYLSGYTAKIPGTELGVSQPTATFSACFGKPFLTVHPTMYAEILGKKMDEHGSKAYLVNTGWCGGSYGVGKRISLKQTRAIINAILSGEIENAEFELSPIFQLQIPKALPNVDSDILNPATYWQDQAAYQEMAAEIAQKFIDNFKKYTTTSVGASLAEVGPMLKVSSKH